MAENNTMDKVIWGIVAAVGAVYGIILKHVYNHVHKGELCNVQTKDNCGEIVRRLDEKFEKLDELDEKLDLILRHVDK